MPLPYPTTRAVGQQYHRYISTHKEETTMDKKNNIILIEYLIIATILIFTSFTPYKAVGMLVALAYLIIESRLRRRQKEESGFNLRGLPRALRENWLFILLVVFVTPLMTVVVGKLFLPEYFTHVLDRVAPYVKMDSIDKLLTQLLILAFGEEIVFRVFLQGRLQLVCQSTVGNPFFLHCVCSGSFHIRCNDCCHHGSAVCVCGQSLVRHHF